METNTKKNSKKLSKTFLVQTKKKLKESISESTNYEFIDTGFEENQVDSSNLIQNCIISFGISEIFGRKYKSFSRGDREFVAFDNGSVLEIYQGSLWKVNSNWERSRKYHGRYPNEDRVIEPTNDFVPREWSKMLPKELHNPWKISGETFVAINAVNKLIGIPEFREEYGIDNLICDYLQRLVGSIGEFRRAVLEYRNSKEEEKVIEKVHPIISELRKKIK